MMSLKSCPQHNQQTSQASPRILEMYERVDSNGPSCPSSSRNGTVENGRWWWSLSHQLWDEAEAKFSAGGCPFHNWEKKLSLVVGVLEWFFCWTPLTSMFLQIFMLKCPVGVAPGAGNYQENNILLLENGWQWKWEGSNKTNTMVQNTGDKDPYTQQAHCEHIVSTENMWPQCTQWVHFDHIQNLPPNVAKMCAPNLFRTCATTMATICPVVTWPVTFKICPVMWPTCSHSMAPKT